MSNSAADVTITRELPQVRDCRYLSLAASTLAMLTGSLVLLGWALRSTTLLTVFPGLAPMKPNTTVCFLLCGAALWCLHLRAGETRSPRRNRLHLAKLLSGLATLIASLTLAEYFLSLNLRIDNLLFPQALAALPVEHAGRMSPATALGFTLLGISLLYLETSSSRRYLTQSCALASGLCGFVALLGYIYNVQALYHVFFYSSMALHTAALFFLLGLGVIVSRPQLGVMATLTSEHLGGLLARRVLPITLVLPPFIGWLRWKAEHAGYFDASFGLALFTLSNVIMFTILLTVSATWINRVDEQRRASALRLAAIVESSADAIVGKDLDGIIISWNHAAELLFGYTAQEIVGHPITTLIPPGRLHEETEILDHIRHGERVKPFETVRLKKDGLPVEISATIFPVRDSQGRVIGAAKISRDITQQKQAAEALRQQAAVLDLAQVLVRDSEGRITLWNTGANRLYGFTREQAMGQVSHLLLKSQFSLPLARIEEELHRTGSWEGEIIHTRRDGRQIVVTSVWVLQRDPAGSPFRIVEANADITARKQAEQQLALQADELSRQAEELARSQQALLVQTRMLRSVLDSIGDGVIAADTQGNFLLWNPAADRILGQSQQAIPLSEWSSRMRIYGADMQTPFPPHDLPLAKAIRGQEAGAELFVRDHSSEHGAWVEVSATPIWDEHGELFGGVAAFRDVTQRKLADHEIHKLNAGLEQRVLERTAQLAAANQELETFSYSVSHDLRAPLRHISGFTRILREDFAPTLSPTAQNYLQRIEDGAGKMGRLINELLNLSRLGRQPLTCHQVALNPLIAEIIGLLEPETGGREIHWKIAGLPTLDCDPVLIRQVFQNLISNALKYSRTRAPAVIEIGEDIRDGQSVIFVRDNGVGFDMKYADKLFGVFQRMHKSEDFEGTGIGLATVRRIIKKHDGSIWFESQPEHGATFYFTLSSHPSQTLQAVAGT